MKILRFPSAGNGKTGSAHFNANSIKYFNKQDNIPAVRPVAFIPLNTGRLPDLQRIFQPHEQSLFW